LRVNDSVQINFAMKVGQVMEKIEVQANTGMVQTQQNTISQVIDQRRIVDLPLNGRDATQLITISGASINHNDGTNTGSKSFFSSQSISIAGSAGDATNYLLDGGDNNDSFTNVNMPFPFPDALAEFSVETSALPARNGLHPGGVVNVVTKSGSNQWHGNLFEFIRNGHANAINYFAPRQDSLKRNQFGGTLGGKSSATGCSSSVVFSNPIFVRTHPPATHLCPLPLRWPATSACSTVPAARPAALRVLQRSGHRAAFS
jgi:Outer membrane receptor for ferrienterochelin and colicins